MKMHEKFEFFPNSQFRCIQFEFKTNIDVQMILPYLQMLLHDHDLGLGQS